VIAQTTIEECDGVADERLEAMGVLSDEIKLWVTRCRQLVGVLQEVEMERDNCKAGEGHAKELGTGFKVKLGDTGNEANVFEEHTRTPIPLDNAHLPISNNAPGDAMVQQATESNNQLEESLARQYDLQARLDTAVTERDAYRRVMVHEQEVLSGYKKRFEQSELSLHNLQAQAEIIAKRQDSHEVDAMGEQSETSHTETQSPATDAAIRAELRTAQRSLEFSRSSQISAHRHYTKALQEIFDFVEEYTKPDPTKRSHIPVSTASPPEDPFGDMYVDFKEEFGWTGKIMLESREAECQELCRRVSFHGYQSRLGPGAGEISRFQSILGQSPGKARFSGNRRIPVARKSCGGPFTLGHIIPSRSDKKAYPATWARWDQIFKDANGSPTALLDIDYIRSTRHGQWPEVSLVIYSWSFYKILATDWDDTNRSKRLLEALVGIWSGCGSNVNLVNTPEFRIYRRSAPIINGYPDVYCEGFIVEEDSDESEEDTDEGTDEETPADHK